jgi:hypothetical protein
MTQEPILFLVSNGLLEHKDRMGAAIWEYLWLIDKVTKDEPDGQGKFNGVVLGGKPLTAATIACDLKEHLNTAKINLRALEVGGYIVRHRLPDNRFSCTVTNSKKWFWNRGPRTENCTTLGQKPVLPRTKTCTSNKEDKTETRQKEKKDTALASQVAPPSLSQKRGTKKTTLPENFGISDRVQKWAQEHGHTRIQERLEQFVGYCRANGKLYADYDEALMNAIRGDWANLNGKKMPTGNALDYHNQLMKEAERPGVR